MKPPSNKAARPRMAGVARPTAQRPVGSSYDLSLRGERLLVHRLADGRRVVVLADLAAIAGRISLADVDRLPRVSRPEIVTIWHDGRHKLGVSADWLRRLTTMPAADVPRGLEALVVALAVAS